jgi:hypothetical protein
MRNPIRLGVIVAVVLGSSLAWSGVRADDDPSATSQAAEQEMARTPPEPSKDVFEPGAASPEPAQAIEEDTGARAEQAWVESIWNSP